MPCLVTPARGLDFDDLGAKVSQELGATRTCHMRGEIEHAQVRQGSHGHGTSFHQVLIAADSAAIRLRLALYEERSNQNPTPFQWKFDRTTLTALLAKIEARQRALADARFTCLQEAA